MSQSPVVCEFYKQVKLVFSVGFHSCAMLITSRHVWRQDGSVELENKVRTLCCFGHGSFDMIYI